MRICEVLKYTSEKLEKGNVENFFFEARSLVEFLTGKTKEWLMIHNDEAFLDEDLDKLNELVEKRISGFPLQYIIGMCSFMGREFFVNENVLIPRADTEVWVEKAINVARENNVSSVLDMCTGSGCIAITMKQELKKVKVFASDISRKSIDVALKNAEHNLAEVEFFYSDLFNDIPKSKFDMIVSNPPYILSGDIPTLQKEVLKEPILALDGGEDGLKFYREITENAGKYLNDNGYLIFEFGYNQVDDVLDILRSNNFCIEEIIKDYSGNVRAIISKKGE